MVQAWQRGKIFASQDPAGFQSGTIFGMLSKLAIKYFYILSMQTYVFNQMEHCRGAQAYDEHSFDALNNNMEF